MNATRSDALELIRRVVAANCACRPEDFLEDGCTIVEAVLRPGRMPFHLGRPHIGLTTFGAGVVVTASAEWIPWARRVVRGLQRDDVFAPACLARIERHVQRSGQPFAGPQHRYVCAEDLWRVVTPPAGVEVESVEAGPWMEPLYDLSFEHALGDRGNTERPDMVAAAARAGDRVVGLAAASADHTDLWQIGVSVLQGHRGAGIGAAVVSACARAVLDAGRVPYYSTHLSNLRSQGAALRCGFVPAWTEAYVYVPRDRRVAGDYLGLRRTSTSPE
jgi:RimJ/RimL family protein N-acetyltransferase